MKLVLDEEMPSYEFVAEAYSAVLSDLPDDRILESHLHNLETGGPEARHDLLRSLLTSDPAFEPWYRHSEAWSFLLAYLGISSPYWEFARSAHEATEEGTDDRDIDDGIGEASPRFAFSGSRPALAQVSAQFFAGKPVEWLPMMRVGSMAKRIDGVVQAQPSVGGHVVYGPYYRLPSGEYRVRVCLDAALPSNGVESSRSVAMLEAASGETYLAQRGIETQDCDEHDYELSFALADTPAQAEPPPIEVRVWTSGLAPLTVSSITIQRVSAKQV
jgi:hypothetical protein